MRCDSHVHIVGPADRYPQVPERTYLAGVASVDTLKRLGAVRGIGRFVIVQPSFYGTDNSATLDALDTLGSNGRGVAVIDPNAASPDTLATFHRRGVRGLRINLYSPVKAPGGDSLELAFAATADAARTMGWHVQVIAPLPVLLANANILSRAPVPVVIDHYGLYGDRRPDSAEGRRLLELLALPHVWVKLSAPYRHDRGPLNTRPDRAWLAAQIEAAPIAASGAATGRIRRRTSSRRAHRWKRRTVRCPTRRWWTSSLPHCRPPVSPTASCATTLGGSTPFNAGQRWPAP